MQKKKIYPLDSTIEKWFEAYMPDEFASSGGRRSASLASDGRRPGKDKEPPTLDFGIRPKKEGITVESIKDKNEKVNSRYLEIKEQAEAKRTELFCRLVILKKERIKSVNDTLEINEIVTKIKCLNALINRIKYGPKFVPKEQIKQWKKPSKNGFISDRTYQFLNQILQKALPKNKVVP